MTCILSSSSVSASINAICLFVFLGAASATSLLGKPTSHAPDGMTVSKGRTLLALSADTPSWEVSSFLQAFFRSVVCRLATRGQHVRNCYRIGRAPQTF